MTFAIREPMTFNLWEVDGEGGSDAGGGEMLFWVLTCDIAKLPDVHAAVKILEGGGIPSPW